MVVSGVDRRVSWTACLLVFNLKMEVVCMQQVQCYEKGEKMKHTTVRHHDSLCLKFKNPKNLIGFYYVPIVNFYYKYLVFEVLRSQNLIGFYYVIIFQLEVSEGPHHHGPIS